MGMSIVPDGETVALCDLWAESVEMKMARRQLPKDDV